MGFFEKIKNKKELKVQSSILDDKDLRKDKPICRLISVNNIGVGKEITSNINILMSLLDDNLINKDFVKFVQETSTKLHFSKLLEDSKRGNVHYIMNGSLKQFKNVLMNFINQNNIYLNELKNVLYGMTAELFEDEIIFGVMKKSNFTDTIIQTSNKFFVENWEKLKNDLITYSIYEDKDISENRISKYELFEMCSITFIHDNENHMMYFKNFMKLKQSEQDEKIPEIIRNVEIPLCFIDMTEDKQKKIYDMTLQNEVDEIDYDDNEN